MQNFNYFTPTRIIFGKDSERQTGELIKAQGCKKILIHYGGQSAKKSGLLDRIKASLDNPASPTRSWAAWCRIRCYLWFIKALICVKKKR
ncbi:iron-containing alcohol dehydrogenase [Bisgaard Taxon 10/6]|nr:iron-containing alcohol dehydrogenase [Exercitatus varius]